MGKKRMLSLLCVVLLAGTWLLACTNSQPDADGPQPVEGGGDADFPAKDLSQPFALGEKGVVTLSNSAPAEIVVQRGAGDPVFKFLIKAGGIADPEIQVAVQTIEPEMSEDLAALYVPITQYALQVHVVGETGYGFMLRPKIEFYFTDDEIKAAQGQGAVVEPLKGNLFVLYMEQRAGKWVPQKSVSIDEATAKITVSNVAGTGAWWLVAQKAQ